MTISDTTEAAILALTFQAVTWANYAINATTSPETNIINALHTADPGDTGTQTTSETTYTSYARVNVARTTGGWTLTGSSISPAAAIVFPTGSGGSGTLSFWSTGKSGGGASPILWSGAVSPTVAAGNGVQPQLLTGSTITLD